MRPNLLNDANQARTVGHVAIVKNEATVAQMRIFVYVVNTVGIEAGRAALDAVDLIAFFEKQLCQVRAVLAGDAGNQCDFAHKRVLG